MNIERTYQKLLSLDPEEDIAYEYYMDSGKELNYFQAKAALAANPDRSKKADFSCLKSLKGDYPQELIDKLKDKNFLGGDADSWRLTEKFFISDGYNVELNNGQRYIHLFPHSHDFFEIECTVYGKCTQTVESHKIKMQAGDIVIIPPGVSHEIYVAPGGITINIKVRRSTFDQTFLNILQNDTPLSDYFAKVLYNKNYKNSLAFHCGNDPFLFDLVLYMYTQQMEEKAYANRVIEGLLATFFAYLIQNYDKNMEFSDGEAGADERMVKIEKYLRQYYRTATLKSTAEHFYLSQPYLSAYIKKHMGISFSELLRSIRLQNACIFLRDNKHKVDDVCEMVGYKDTTQFIRTFKLYYGATPKQYQKKANNMKNF